VTASANHNSAHATDTIYVKRLDSQDEFFTFMTGLLKFFGCFLAKPENGVTESESAAIAKFIAKTIS